MHQTGEQTKARLQQAFWQLYQQQPIETITVNQIATAAQLHRSTFYLHFQDVYQVLEIMEQQLMTAIQKLNDDIPVTDTAVTQFAEGLRLVFQHHQGLVNEVVIKQRDYQFASQVKLVLQQKVTQLFQLPSAAKMAPEQQFAVNNVVQLMTQLFLNWAADPTVDFAQLRELTAGIMRQGALPTLAHTFGVNLTLDE